ncbi:MAG: phosphatase [Candidatus Meridianibacter frigidus]|nr:MAG: phosphatase [Candidatus Eremiobacteraeota bacterium]
MGKRGVGIFSITDHDTLAAYDVLESAPIRPAFVGIEVNTTYRENEVHVLGYRLDRKNAALQAALENNRAARRLRVAKIVRQIQAAGYEVTMEQVEAESRGGVLGRPHVGRALIRHGHVSDIESAFRNVLFRGGPGYVPSTHMGPHEAIAVIRAAGGIAVLAHPGRLRDHSIVGELVEEGLAGLEVFYPRHDASATHYFRAMAKRLNLLMTGGSDFHDARYHRRGVGMEVDAADIQPFLDAVA